MIEKRASLGRRAGLIGVVSNAFLSVMKIGIGIGSGSMAVLGDGMNNFFDTASAFVSLISFRLAGRPSDREHPFGHARAEYIGSFIIAMAILYVAITLFRQGIDRILNPVDIKLSLLELALLAFSVLLKIVLFFYYTSLAKKIDSDLLRATALDTEGDVFTTIILLTGLIVSPMIGFALDGPMAIAVSIMVGKNGWDILKKNFDELLGASPNPDFINKLGHDIKSYDGVSGVHDIIVHNYGPNNKYVSADLELAGDWGLVEAHNMVSKIEADLEMKYGLSITIHPEPGRGSDPNWLKYKNEMERVVLSYGPDYSLRDFQIIRGGKKPYIIFELALPWDEKRDMSLIQEELEEKANKAFPSYKVHIHVKRNLNDDSEERKAEDDGEK